MVCVYTYIYVSCVCVYIYYIYISAYLQILCVCIYCIYTHNICKDAEMVDLPFNNLSYCDICVPRAKHSKLQSSRRDFRNRGFGRLIIKLRVCSFEVPFRQPLYTTMRV